MSVSININKKNKQLIKKLMTMLLNKIKMQITYNF